LPSGKPDYRWAQEWAAAHDPAAESASPTSSAG